MDTFAVMPLGSPRVSVLVTLYNKGPYVEEAVRSALNSTYRDLEVLVVDDASTDGGDERIMRINDPRIRMVRSPRNRGRAGAANLGFDSARGEFIAILDADDRMHSERIAKQVAFLDAHPDVVVCGTWIRGFGEREHLHRPPPDDQGARAIMLFGVPVSYGTAMFRRSTMDAHHVRCRTEWRTPGMDYLLVLDMGSAGRYANLQEVLTEYRLGGQNMRHGRDQWTDDLRLFQAVFDRFHLPVTPAEIEAHLVLNRTMPLTIDGALVRRVRQWCRRLLLLAEAQGGWPMDLLREQVERRWAELFYLLVEKAPLAAWEHWRLQPSMAGAKLLLKCAWKGWRPRPAALMERQAST